MVIRRFGVWSVAKLSGTLYGCLGLIFGIIVALISVVAAGASSALRDSNLPMAGMLPAFFGVGAVILLPIMYGLMGLIFGALTAALYNLIAGWVGGIEMEVH